MQKHPAVAQGVRFHSFESEELRDTLVIGTQQLRVDIGVDRRLTDLHEPVLGEEVHFEGEAENPANPEPACGVEQLLQQPVPDAGASCVNLSKLGPAGLRVRPPIL